MCCIVGRAILAGPDYALKMLTEKQAGLLDAELQSLLKGRFVQRSL